MNNPDCPECGHFTAEHGEYGCTDCQCAISFYDFHPLGAVVAV